MTKIRAGLIAAALACGLNSQVKAQEKYDLRFADSLPATHLFTKEVALPWMEAVTAGSEGAITTRLNSWARPRTCCR